MINLHVLINIIHQSIKHLGKYACQGMVPMVTVSSDGLCGTTMIHLVSCYASSLTCRLGRYLILFQKDQGKFRENWIVCCVLSECILTIRF